VNIFPAVCDFWGVPTQRTGDSGFGSVRSQMFIVSTGRTNLAGSARDEPSLRDPTTGTLIAINIQFLTELFLSAVRLSGLVDEVLPKGVL
jgi:hypothetical protein